MTMHNRVTVLFVVLGLLAACPAFADSGFTCNGGVSTSFDVTGQVINPQTFNLQQLQAITPSTTIWDYIVSGSTTSQGEFSGVLLWDLLNLVGIKVNPNVKDDLHRKYIVVTGTDCYQSVYAMGEIDPTLSGADQPTVADAQWVNGKQSGLGSNGFAELIVPADKTDNRMVFNVAHIQVMNVRPPSGE
jgi:hypothetical protein